MEFADTVSPQGYAVSSDNACWCNEFPSGILCIAKYWPKSIHLARADIMLDRYRYYQSQASYRIDECL